MRTRGSRRLLEDKIKKRAVLKKILAGLRQKRKKIVFTNGCFDLLHYGHVKYLQEAKEKGDVLVVAVNSDSSVRAIKGRKRPFVSAQDRMRLIAALESVDYVLLFKEKTPLKVIRIFKPDILIKGADWDTKKIAGRDFVLAAGGKVSTVKLLKGRSTTTLIRKIAKLFR